MAQIAAQIVAILSRLRAIPKSCRSKLPERDPIGKSAPVAGIMPQMPRQNIPVTGEFQSRQLYRPIIGRARSAADGQVSEK
jgi:hypothetical protein